MKTLFAWSQSISSQEIDESFHADVNNNTILILLNVLNSQRSYFDVFFGRDKINLIIILQQSKEKLRHRKQFIYRFRAFSTRRRTPKHNMIVINCYKECESYVFVGFEKTIFKWSLFKLSIIRFKNSPEKNSVGKQKSSYKSLFRAEYFVVPPPKHPLAR